jgi:hypothetical protein
MSFEYRELTTQVFFNAAGKRHDDEDEDEDGGGCPCQSSLTGACPCTDETQPQCTLCTQATEGKRDKDKDKERETLAFLRQQLREAVAAG